MNDPANRWAAEAAKALNAEEFHLVSEFIGSMGARAVEPLPARQAKAWEIASVLAKAGLTWYEMAECNAVINVEILADKFGISPAATAEAYAQIVESISVTYGEDFRTKRAFVLFEAVRGAR